MRHFFWITTILIHLPVSRIAFAQTSLPSSASQAGLQSLKPEQLHVARNTYLIECGSAHGTGFLSSARVIITNAHVIEGCDHSSTVVKALDGEVIPLKEELTDDNRDLALLVPTRSLQGGLVLGRDEDLKIGDELTTWGFPLIYTSGVPLLTRGYLSGVSVDAGTTDRVKHFVVNGAFNPGNSGGPVLGPSGSRVVGVVVWRRRLTSQNVPIAIQGLMHSPVFTSSSVTKTLPNGQKVGMSNEEVIASVLDEFYNLVQVQIGEAIAVSEIQAFINENMAELGRTLPKPE